MATISLEDIAADSHTIDVDLGAVGSLTVTYRPNAVTPAFELSLKHLDTTTEDGMNEMLGIFAHVVADWDLVGPMPKDGSLVKAGDKCPLDDPAVLRLVSSRVLMKVLRDCLAAPADPKPSTPSKR